MLFRLITEVGVMSPVSLTASSVMAAIPERSIGLVLVALSDLLAIVTNPWVVATLVVVLAWYGSKFVTSRIRPRLEDRLRASTTNLVLVAFRVAVVFYAFVPFAGLLGSRPQNVLLSFTSGLGECPGA